MNNDDLIDEWDNEDYEVFNQWDEEAKNKRLEELEEYFKSDMEIRAKLITKIEQKDRYINSLLHYTNDLETQLQQKENIIKEVREYVDEWNSNWYATGSEEDHQRLHELLEILDKENK